MVGWFFCTRKCWMRWQSQWKLTASDLRLWPPTSDLRLRLLLKDVNAPIYGIVGARIAFEGIAMLKNSCMGSSFSKFLKLAMFFVCTVWWWEKCETFCAVLTKNVNEAAKKRDRLGWFLMESGQTGSSLYCFLSGTAMVTIVSQWYSAETHCEQDPGYKVRFFCV